MKGEMTYGNQSYTTPWKIAVSRLIGQQPDGIGPSWPLERLSLRNASASRVFSPEAPEPPGCCGCAAP